MIASPSGLKILGVISIVFHLVNNLGGFIDSFTFVWVSMVHVAVSLWTYIAEKDYISI